MLCSNEVSPYGTQANESFLITFNDILRSAGVDPTNVRLVRHHDTGRRGPTIYGAFRSPDGRRLVEEYQRVQHRKAFVVGELVASFIVTPRPRNETLFIGLYRVASIGLCDAGARDPIFGDDIGGMNRYQMVRDNCLLQYEERLDRKSTRLNSSHT